MSSAEVTMIAMPGTLVCRACFQALPPDAFHRHRNRRTGHHEVCKSCRGRASYGSYRTAKQAADRWAVLRVVRAIRKGQLPNSARVLLGPLLIHLGGAEGLAAAIWREYEAAPPGGRTRFGVLQAILEMARVLHEEASVDAVKRSHELASMSNEELAAAIEEGYRDFEASKGTFIALGTVPSSDSD